MKSLAVDQRQKIIDAMEKKEYKEFFLNILKYFLEAISHIHGV